MSVHVSLRVRHLLIQLYCKDARGNTRPRDSSFRFEVYFFLARRRVGHPRSISRYDSFDTVDFDLGRLLPARFLRLMFATSEFFLRFAMK